jgi:acyl-coenzyme A synthetase/AMP-(fatty) acid ligase
VDVVDVIGLEHEILGEGIFAYVRPKEGAALSAEDVLEHCKGIASFKRPQHVELWPVGEPFPLTRSAKVDKLAMKRLAEQVVADLRTQGKWDSPR